MENVIMQLMVTLKEDFADRFDKLKRQGQGVCVLKGI